MSEPFSYESIARFYSAKPKKVPFEGTVDHSSGWKLSYLSDIFNKTFAGYSQVPFSISSNFICKKDFHVTPAPSCICGFHAYFDKSKAIYNLERLRPLLLLEVELYGDILIHKDGVRASEQDIKAVYLPKRCGFWACRRGTAGLRKSVRYFRPACPSHIANNPAKPGFTLDTLQLYLGIPVKVL